MRWPRRAPDVILAPLPGAPIVRVSPGQGANEDPDRFGFECKGWAAFVSMNELARLGIGWDEIDAACAAPQGTRTREIGDGLLLGNPKAVLAYLGMENDR